VGHRLEASLMAWARRTNEEFNTGVLVKFGVVAFGVALAVGLTAWGNSFGPDRSTPAHPSGLTETSYDWDTNGDHMLTVGFAQAGSGSGWRLANSQSFKNYFIEANGFKLLSGDANGDDATQKAQVRDFITEGAEVIVLAPIGPDDWEPVLQEVRAAGIPMINVDRRLTALDRYFQFFFGSDFRAEGDNVVAWMEKHFASKSTTGADVKIVYLTNQTGCDSCDGRDAALNAGVQKDGWKLVSTGYGGFDRGSGQHAMKLILDSMEPTGFNTLYSLNDEMTLGAIDAMKAKGLDPQDYTIVSFGGERAAVQMVVDGAIDVIGQANPYYGPQLGHLIIRASRGETIPTPQYATEAIIDSTRAARMLADGDTFDP